MKRWFDKFNPFKKKLEDGDIITQEDGIYRQCPECGALVPQLVEVPDFNKMKPGEHPLDMEAVKGNLQPIIDPRHMITGKIDLETNESKLHCQCIVCGMPLKDKDAKCVP